MDNQTLLYHYTSVDGLYGIIENKNIRLTNISYLNDSKELVLATIKFKSHMREMVENLKINNEATELSIFNGFQSNKEEDKFLPQNHFFAELLIDYIEGYLDKMLSAPAIYTASFCEKGNLLRQWMAYCSNGGYSIGFDRQMLKTSIEGAGKINLSKVGYDMSSVLSMFSTDDFEELSKQTSSQYDKIFTACQENQELALASDDFKDLLANILSEVKKFASNIAQFSITHKHLDFQYELEHRLIKNSGHFDSAGNYVENLNGINFYPKNSLLVPHIQHEITLDAIKKVFIGPMSNQHLAYLSLLRFRDSKKLDFEVVKSEISLRTL